MTTGYSAGVETNQTQISYAVESVFCGGSTSSPVAPATTFQAIRYVSETLSGQKTRQRPSEINLTRESTQAVTVSETASGTISGALSFGTYDDFMASALNSTWQAEVPIAGIAGDVTLTNVSSTSANLTSTLGTKFAAVTAGSWIRLFGFTNAANNGFYHVTSKTDGGHLVLASLANTVTETPAATAAQVRYSSIGNGSAFTSLYIQQKLASNLWLQYPGSYVTGFTIQGSVGQFIQSNFNVVATQEKSATADGSTGGVLPAPNGTVHNSVSNFGPVMWNNVPISAVVDQFALTVENTGSSAEYGLGSSYAQGILAGTFTVTGNLRMYFKDFVFYNDFKNETVGSLSFITRDGAGNAYVFSIPNCTLMNPNVNAGGPGQAIMATFSLEGNPVTAGGTLSIDALSAT